MRFDVVKRHKRLWIIDKQTDQAVYTPPDFVKLQSRDPMHQLASDLTLAGRRDINLIAVFEGKYSKRCSRNCSK